MNNIEDYQNLVELLKMALTFYADNIHYQEISGESSRVSYDGGSQARFALDKIKELEKTYEDMKIEYIDAGDKSSEEIIDMVNRLKNGQD